TVNDEVKNFSLNKDVVSIGKLSGNDFQLPDNSVSRNHCKLEKTRDGFKICDQGSTNGTFVNGKKIKNKLLKKGDNITIGRTTLTFLPVAGEEKTGNFSDQDDQKISMVLPLSDRYLVPQEKKLESVRLGIMNSLTILGKELIASTTLEDSFEKVGELIFEFLQPKRLFVFFYDERQGDLDLKYSHTQKGKKEKEKINISKTIAMKAIKEKVAILSSNTQDDARFDGAKSIIMYGIRSAISVPIWTKSSIYGLIYIDTTEFNKMFEDKELEILSIIANFTGLSIEGINSRNKLIQEKKIRSRLERYHSPSVVSRIMASQESTTMELMLYKETEASVLFMDIVGFTTRVEKMSAVEIGVFLNSFFTEMTDIIFQHNGTLDKYIGDCIMAVFGVPFEIDNHAELSITTALDMMEKLEERNLQLKPKDQIKIRIGINSGKLISGDFGSPKRLDYTVLGNAVNIASRLESSVAASNEIVVSEDTYKLTGDLFEFESLGNKKLQGLSVPVEAFKVIRRKGAK
ncbi:MAG: FHA domain-containing protein, partial [bacterium]|nr:FHA domain-containing protein [bacterium]